MTSRNDNPYLGRSARARRRRMWRKDAGGNGGVAEELQLLVRQWILRIMVPLEGARQFVRPHGFDCDEIARFVGLGEWVDMANNRGLDLNSTRIHSRIRENLLSIYRSAVSDGGPLRAGGCLGRNVAALGAMLDLSETDCRVLEFVIIVHGCGMLREATELLGSLSTEDLYRNLARILDMPEQQVRETLKKGGALQNCGLVKVDQDKYCMRNKLDLLMEDACDDITHTDMEPHAMFADILAPAAQPQLRLGDYGYRKELDFLVEYLRGAIKRRERGVNFYIYGPPGTGKTQLVRALAQHLRCPLHEVTGADKDGDPISGTRRMQAQRLAQHLLGKGRNLLLFDEAEDAMGTIAMGAVAALFGIPSRGATINKAWMNRTLEENRVPTLWVSNSSQMDPAFARRFHYCMEMAAPPIGKRRQIIAKACDGLLPDAHLERLAESAYLSPALVRQTADMVRGVQARMGGDASARAFDRVINAHLKMQGRREIRRDDPNRLPGTYDPAVINADSDPIRIADGLVRARSGRLCLYGPPGTGKTAFGRWLAGRLQVPMLVRRTSDILSPFVGMTERNLAEAFAEAERDGALLLMDEVDSFLQDRRRAQRSWETTRVNEMLTQMESFPGVFIASTNLADGLDQAALRRFDLKMKFDYLRPQQAWSLFRSHCRQLGLPLAGDSGLRPQLERIANLTPGDFAAVERQHRFRKLQSARELLRALVQECEMKEGSRSPIGFKP